MLLMLNPLFNVGQVCNKFCSLYFHYYKFFTTFTTMQSFSSSSDSDSSKKEDINAKQKFITFRSPDEAKQIIAKIPIPRYIHLSRNEVHDLQALRNKLKMLYVDVLCRGYHPVKGFEAEAKNIFKQIESCDKLSQRNLRITRLCNNEAVGTIWRCLAREIGRPLKKYCLKEVQVQLFDELELMRQKAEKQWKQKGNKENNVKQSLCQLTNIENAIRQQLMGIKERSKKEQKSASCQRDIIAQVLAEQILSLEREVFVRSIVGIRQSASGPQYVEVLMQQCYPSIIMSKKLAIQQLGETIFEQKYEFYAKYRQKCRLDAENEVICCHRCLIPLNQFERLTACNDEYASLEVAYTLLTDPYLYCRAVINENCTPKAPANFMHPYLIYYCATESPAVCNRYFCNKCEGMEPSLYTAGSCGFCEGLCDCFRCQNMDLLTKMMAVFLDAQGDLKPLINKFLMKFHTRTLQTSKKKKMGRQLNRKEQFGQYLQLFLKQKIFRRKQNGERYEPIKYFKERPIGEGMEKGQKNKMGRMQLQEEKTDRQDRMRKERQVNEQIKRLNRIIQGGEKRRREMVQEEREPEQGNDVYFDDSDS